jgi:hypothetical protein
MPHGERGTAGWSRRTPRFTARSLYVAPTLATVAAMKPCVRCHRHVRRAATACPFCGVALLDVQAPATWALGLAMLAACGGDKMSDDSTSSTTSQTSEAQTTTADDTTTTGTPTTTAPTTTDLTTSGCGTACVDTTEATGFIYGAPDLGSLLECSIETEDCPDGQKCMPWVSDGSNMWNALKCVPIDPDPVGVGEACVAPGNGQNGEDNCDKHVMCFEVNGDNGICRAMCDNGACAPEFNCLSANDGILELCLPACDLQAPMCEPGHTCIPVAAGGVCAPG